MPNLGKRWEGTEAQSRRVFLFQESGPSLVRSRFLCLPHPPARNTFPHFHIPTLAARLSSCVVEIRAGRRRGRRRAGSEGSEGVTNEGEMGETRRTKEGMPRDGSKILSKGLYFTILQSRAWNCLLIRVDGGPSSTRFPLDGFQKNPSVLEYCSVVFCTKYY